MKKILITVFASIISLTLNSQNTMTKDTMTYEQKISYMIGYNIGSNFKRAPFTFDVDAMSKGLKVALEGQDVGYTEQEIMETLQAWEKNMQEEDARRAASASEGTKAEGKAFLEKNKLDKDVKVTESGLQYKVVTMGTGAKPTSPSDRVTVHYEGKLLDGTIFDSSYQRGETISFGLNQVISGWTEGLQLMPIGSKFILYVPAELGYGDRAMPTIPAGSTLIFTVELFGINE